MIVCRFEDEFDTMHTIDLDVINHLGQFRGPLLYSSSPSIQDTKVVVDGCKGSPKGDIVRTKIDSSDQRFQRPATSVKSCRAISKLGDIGQVASRADSR